MSWARIMTPLSGGSGDAAAAAMAARSPCPPESGAMILAQLIPSSLA